MNAVLEQISKIGIVPVVKIDNAADALPLAKALCAGGLPCAEVTFRTSAAAEAIKIMTDNFPSMCVGAGTVLNAEQVDAAVAAGAKFIVSPGLNPRTVKYVRENYRRFCEAAGFEVENIVTSDQAHTTKVRYVTKADCGSGVTRDRDFHDIDGMITDEPGVVLATFYADCVPLYFVDPVHRAIGLSHSGWRGTVHKMGQATLDAMHERFGTEAKDVIAAVGPSICQECYEVSGDVIEEFRAAFPETLHEKLFCGKPDGKYQLNLWEANHQILLAAGVPEKQIHLPNLCTCCNPDFLYSHRASKGKRGNLAAFLSLV